MSFSTASNVVNWIGSIATALSVTFAIALFACGVTAAWFLPSSLARGINDKLQAIGGAIEKLADQDANIEGLHTRLFTLRMRVIEIRLRTNRAPGLFRQIHAAVFKGIWVELYRLNRAVNALRLDVEIAFDEWHRSFTGGMLSGVPLQVLWNVLPVAPEPAHDGAAPAHRAAALAHVFALPDIPLTIV